jgi:PIN domain nuclease of toxin-antitoxin system
MKILLDTHTFIWWDSDSSQLSPKVYNLIKDEKGENEVYLSSVSVWEISIKHQIGKLPLNKPLEEIVRIQQDENQFQILPVTLAHALKVGDLPLHHKDPFDRLLVAQAIVEDFTLITKEPILSQYAANVIW